MRYFNIIKANPILEMNMDTSPILPTAPVTVVEEEEEAEDSVSTLLQMALLGEYQQWDLYVSYASRLRGLSRSEIADEFKDHAKEEQDHIELIQRYLVTMGVIPTLKRKPIPEMPSDAIIKDIVQLQLTYEQEAILLYKKILSIIPENEPLKIDVENIMIKEQEHAHDLQLLLKQQEPIMAEFRDSEGYFRATEPGEPTKPQAGYGKGCGCNCANCSCDPSFLSKVNYAWCAKALKELTPEIYARWYQGQLLSAQEKAFVAHALAVRWGLKDKRAILRFLDFRNA
jgi:bacterioferritin